MIYEDYVDSEELELYKAFILDNKVIDKVYLTKLENYTLKILRHEAIKKKTTNFKFSFLTSIMASSTAYGVMRKFKELGVLKLNWGTNNSNGNKCIKGFVLKGKVNQEYAEVLIGNTRSKKDLWSYA